MTARTAGTSSIDLFIMIPTNVPGPTPASDELGRKPVCEPVELAERQPVTLEDDRGGVRAARHLGLEEILVRVVSGEYV